MAREHLAVASAALTLVCVVPYLRDVRRGSTRPQRTSWLVFAALATVAAVSQAAAGSGAGTWLAAGSAVGFAAVFASSVRSGTGGARRADVVTLAVAGIGTAVSIGASRPVLAVVGVVVAEAGAVALTVRKAWADPSSETRATWTLDCLAGAIAVAAVHEVSVASLLYPVHHTVANGVVVAAIVGAERRSRLAVA